MRRIDHTKTPLFTALKEHMNRDVIPFHVPGHKYGRGNPNFEFFGEYNESRRKRMKILIMPAILFQS